MNINKLKEIFEARKLTQNDVSILIGMSKTNLNQILNGYTEPKIGFLNKLKEKLGISIGFLFDEVTEQNTIKQVANGNNNVLMANAHQIEILKIENDSLKNELRAKNETIKALQEQIKILIKNH
jgi:transcriptional regulator with XRE-family HTH domain